MSEADIREGERTTPLPDHFDANVYFIGRIRTPWPRLEDCPKRGEIDGPLCRLQVDARWSEAIEGLEPGRHLDILYWMHFARRDLVRQNPKTRGVLFGTFALRSPMRPNPIACSPVLLVDVEKATTLIVRGLDCIDGTPLIDIKPYRCPIWPPDADAGC